LNCVAGTKSATPFIIPFFIAHQGCPHQCIFCNQHVITGTSRWLTAEKIHEEIVRCLAWPRDVQRQVQVAFYGGSFTGLERGRQVELLEAVQPFIRNGEVDLIRLSTRPDYVDQTTAFFLKERGVALVELGIQSFEPEVLTRCRRGHCAEQIPPAVACLKQAGISVGGQIMVGLPGETTNGLLDGARKLIDLRPDMVRIYPALVLTASPLAELYAMGEYRPLSLNRAVALCARLKDIFSAAGIPVVRMGLQPSDSLERDIIAGPYHPGFGELVLSRLFFKKIRKLLSVLQTKRGMDKIRLILSAADQSVFYGWKRCAVKRLTSLGLLDGIEVNFSPDLSRSTIEYEIV